MAAARETEDVARTLIRHQHEHPPVRDLNREVERRTTAAHRIADDFGRLVGSWTFVLIQTVLAVAWLVLNFAAVTNHWDPYPFQLLNLVFSFEAAAWASLVLMSINRQVDRDRIRAQNEFETEVREEEELKAVMTHLEVQDEVLLQILHRLDRADRELRRIARRTGSEDSGS
jgi:uncharacterized membrane protein